MNGGQARDGGKTVDDVVGQVARHGLVGGMCLVVAENDGVAISRGPRRRLCADDAARTTAIIDHDSLAEQRRGTLAHHPCQDIRATPGRSGNDEAQRRGLRARDRGQRKGCSDEDATLHGRWFLHRRESLA